jgi:hypothetical protein
MPITEVMNGTLPTANTPVTSMAEEPTLESDEEHVAASATPAAMPVTGAGNGSGLAIMLTVAAVLALLIGYSLWEKRGEVG